MANYEEKKVYYIPAFVERIEELGNYPVRVSFPIGEERLAVQFEDLPDLMFTAEEVADSINFIAKETHEEYAKMTIQRIQELKKENALHREAIRNRDKEVARLEADRDEWKKVAANNAAFYNEANKTASEAAEANDELKAKIAKLKDDNDNLRGQIGKLTTSIQNLTSDVNFYKTEHDKWLNTAQDNAKLVDALQEENKKLKQELKDAEATYNVVADTSIKRNNMVKTMEEVIVALVEKIRRLEGDD